MKPEAVAAIKRTLEAERDELEHQLREHGALADRDEVDVDIGGGFADSPQVTAERGELLAIVEQLRERHADRLHALRRIDEGTYGTCERCGDEIPVERLEAVPATRLCMGCKSLAV